MLSPVMEAQVLAAQMQQMMDMLQNLVPSYVAALNALEQEAEIAIKLPAHMPLVAQPTSTARTFGQILEQWLKNCENDKDVKESTVSCYAHVVAKHIMPELGAVPALEITKDLLEAFLEQKRCSGRLDGKGGLSAKSTLDIYQIIASAMRWALKEQRVPYNPIADVPCPKSADKDMRVLTEGEQIRLEDALTGDERVQAVAVWLSLYLGLRVGEVCAVQWGDVDFRRRRVHIRRTIQRMQELKNGRPSGKTTIRIGPPKSFKSNRWLPIQDFLWDILLAHQSRIPESDKQAECYILQQLSGKYFEPRSIQRYFDGLCRQVGLADANYHCLRHTFATRALERRVDYKTLSDLLGHTSLEVTMRYAHALDALKRQEIEKLERVSAS